MPFISLKEGVFFVFSWTFYGFFLSWFMFLYFFRLPKLTCHGLVGASLLPLCSSSLFLFGFHWYTSWKDSTWQGGRETHRNISRVTNYEGKRILRNIFSKTGRKNIYLFLRISVKVFWGLRAENCMPTGNGNLVVTLNFS